MAAWRVRELHKLVLEAQGAPDVTVHRPCRCLEATPLQHWSSGGVGAAILETFITLEASQGTTTPSEPSATHLIVGGLGPPKTT